MVSFKRTKFIFVVSLVLIFFLDYLYPAHWVFYLIPVSLFLIYIVSASSILSLNVFTKAYTHPVSSRKELALTFDDGPSLNTLEVLDVLKTYNVRATFFCIGQKIEKYPEVMKRIVAEGHVVGSHSYHHSYWFPFYSSKRITDEINQTSTLISKFTSKESVLFRPPFGVMSPRIAQAVENTKQLVIGWNLRSFDASTKNKDKVINRIKSKLKAGSVLLLHDDRPNTFRILESILQYAQAGGYKFADIPTIFSLKQP